MGDIKGEQQGFGRLRCRCGRARIEQRSTGALYLIIQIPQLLIKQPLIQMDEGLFSGGAGGI